MLSHQLLFHGQVLELLESYIPPDCMLNVCHRSLSNDEANSIHAQVISNLKDKFGVEIR